MFYQWFAVTLVYYGLSYSSTDLAGDPYTNFCSSVAIEIPGLFLLSFNRRDRYNGEHVFSLILNKYLLLRSIYRVFVWPICNGMLGKTTHFVILPNYFGSLLHHCWLVV